MFDRTKRKKRKREAMTTEDEIARMMGPDTGGYPDPRLGVPDSHIALRLLKEIVTPAWVRLENHEGEVWLTVDMDLQVDAAEADLIRRLKES
jgi:hypothetical protein